MDLNSSSFSEPHWKFGSAAGVYSARSGILFAFCKTSVACALAPSLSAPVSLTARAAAAPGGKVCKDKDGGEVEVENEEDNDEDWSKGSKDD